MPELEKRGLITRKLGTPSRFTAIKPEIALKTLTKTRIKAMKEEARNLGKKTDELISQLKKTSYGIEEENSIEKLSQQDNVLIRLIRMTKKARQQIMTASSFEQLETVFLKNMKKTIGTKPNQISVHAIVGGSEPNEQTQEFDDVHTFRLLQMTQTRNSKIELRRVEMLPFNLLIVDGKEAMWGEFQPEDSNRTILWTNDSTQISILKMAFENLWRESQRIDCNLDLL
jgi:sugar-specific transcriptional regulator TrmB